MQIKSCHVFFKYEGNNQTSVVTIEVPGLGEVSIKDFISDALRNWIEKESIYVLRMKLGQISLKEESEDK